MTTTPLTAEEQRIKVQAARDILSSRYINWFHGNTARVTLRWHATVRELELRIASLVVTLEPLQEAEHAWLAEREMLESRVAELEAKLKKTQDRGWDGTDAWELQKGRTDHYKKVYQKHKARADMWRDRDWEYSVEWGEDV